MWKRLTQTGGKWALGVAAFGGVIAGVIGWGGFNTVMEMTNSLEFCISCHEMRDTVFKEYQASIHYSNPAGVRAVCSDCHVPKDWTHKIVRKVQASNELWHKFMGTIDTPEKFEAERLRLAQHVWDTMKATDSRECRNCHSFGAMDFAHQRPEASKQMQQAMKDGGTCIDCHKGIAHKLPDMTTGWKSLYKDLLAAAAKGEAKAGDRLYTIATSPFWVAAPGAEAGSGDGKVIAATPVEILERDGDHVRVALSGWQQEGAERILYAAQGKRILNAALAPAAVEKVAPVSTMTDPDTDQVWTEARLEGWMKATAFVADPAAIDAYGSEMFNASCGVCHAAPPKGHYLANQWIGTLNAMKRFVALDDEQYRFLQKYVQMNAKDIAKDGGHDG